MADTAADATGAVNQVAVNQDAVTKAVIPAAGLSIRNPPLRHMIQVERTPGCLTDFRCPPYFPVRGRGAAA